MLYWFRPNGHWNVVTKECYEFLLRFYDASWLTTTAEKENPNEGEKK